MQRRELLSRLGVGAAALTLAPGLAWSRSRVPSRGSLWDLAEAIRSSDNIDLLLRSADHRFLMDGAFLANALEFESSLTNGFTHPALMAGSAFPLSFYASPLHAHLMGIYSVHDFRQAHPEHESRNGIRSTPLTTGLGSFDAAKGEFTRAMELADTELADRALVAILEYAKPKQVFDRVWQRGAEALNGTGHQVALVAQARRFLERWGWQYSTPVMRWLVHGLAPLCPSGHAASNCHRSRELLPELQSINQATAKTTKNVPDESGVLLQELRGCSSEGAQRLVLEFHKCGLGEQTIWDGLRLYAAELFHQRPSTAMRDPRATEPLISLSALSFGHRTSETPVTRQFLLLQAAGWLPQVRDDLERTLGALEGSGLDILGRDDADTMSLKAAFRNRSAGHARHGLDHALRPVSAFLRRSLSQVVPRGTNHQLYPFLDAVTREAHITDRVWQSRLLAPAVTYLPDDQDAPTELYQQSRRLLLFSGTPGYPALPGRVSREDRDHVLTDPCRNRELDCG